VSDNRVPNGGPPEEDDPHERTAVVSLSEFRTGAAKRQVKDRPLLIRARGAQLGQVTLLGASVQRVGRSTDCEIWLSDDRVSRRHASISPDQDGYVIEDTQSANGTFVAGQRIERAVLRDGDLIQFGPQAIFRYSIADQKMTDFGGQL
jgi:pSer/pThr/pTyr-binding forkhead associated (FHA) protein